MALNLVWFFFLFPRLPSSVWGRSPPVRTGLGAPTEERFAFATGRRIAFTAAAVRVTTGTTTTTTAASRTTTTSTTGGRFAPFEVTAERQIVAGVAVPAEETHPGEQVGEERQQQQPTDDGERDQPPGRRGFGRRSHLRERLGAHHQRLLGAGIEEPGQQIDIVQSLDREVCVRADAHDVDPGIVTDERRVPEAGRDGHQDVRFRAERVDVAHDPDTLGRLAGAIHLDRTVGGGRPQYHGPVTPDAPQSGAAGTVAGAVQIERIDRRPVTDEFGFAQYLAVGALLAFRPRRHIEGGQGVQVEEPLALRFVVRHLERPVDHQLDDRCTPRTVVVDLVHVLDWHADLLELLDCALAHDLRTTPTVEHLLRSGDTGDAELGHPYDP
uniref:Putative secreted protein n=1 Tax=Anopheles darlingi TaxID=43151 RepID=A0A2M4DDZ5_ANODA